MIDPERELTERHGPPEERARKNRKHIDHLLTQVSESELRGILAALSRLEWPLCARWLSEVDLATTPLDKILKPYEFMGLNFDFESVEAPFYVVSIGAAWGTVGDGGTFRVRRDGDQFRVDEDYKGETWIC